MNKKVATGKKALAHYVDNKLLYTHMIKYINEYRECKKNDLPAPRIPEYIGSCILKIATKLSYKSNFISYTYKEEMIGDGIENCIAYMHNFNPEKSNNPFAYFTMIIYNAFLHRIAKEHKQTYVKYKVFENLNVLDELMEYMGSGEGGTDMPAHKKGSNHHYKDHVDRMDKFVTDYEAKLQSKNKPAKKKGVEVFIEEDNNAEGIQQHSATDS